MGGVEMAEMLHCDYYYFFRDYHICSHLIAFYPNDHRQRLNRRGHRDYRRERRGISVFGFPP